MYSVWPEVHAPPDELAGHRPFFIALAGEAAFAALLCIPTVSHATGIAWPVALAILGTCAVLTAIKNFVLAPRARRGARWLHALLVFDLAMRILTPLALLVASGDPRSPLWSAMTLVACLTGAYHDVRPSLAVLVAFLVAPLVTIPVYRASGADPDWSIAAPIIHAMLAAIGYHTLAGYGQAARIARTEQQRINDALRREMTQLARDRLARDLHDSVGSALSIAGMTSDLIERHAHDPAALGRVAHAQREATSHGLGELRELLDAMSPAHAALDLGASLRAVAGRLGRCREIPIDFVIDAPAAVRCEGGARLATLRIFQEALHNALKHAKPSRIRVRLAVGATQVQLEVHDDGGGFADARHGRGLSNMRERAAELGGTCAIASVVGAGTSVKLALPNQLDT